MKRKLVLGAAIAVMATWAECTSAALLAVDVNDRTVVSDPGNTVAGYEPFILGGTTAAVGSATSVTGSGYTITVTAVNAVGTAIGGIDDRDRANPTTAPSLNQIYDDFIFTATGVGIGGGIDMTINGGTKLLPNTRYGVAIFTYDSDSTPAPQPRTADWFDGNNANALVLMTSFNAATAPTTDYQYRFTGSAVTDGAGTLFLRGRSTTGVAASAGVILNGFEIIEIPEPASLCLGLVGGIGWCVGRRKAGVRV
jgi:hypothetical protein